MADNLFSEDWAIIGVYDPDANAAGEVLTAAIDMSLWEQIAVISQAGDLGASGGLVTSVTASATSAGVYAALSGKTTTIGSDSPNIDSNKVTVIHVRSEELTSNKRYLKVSFTVQTATSDTSGIVFGKARLRPAYTNDISAVLEIVN